MKGREFVTRTGKPRWILSLFVAAGVFAATLSFAHTSSTVQGPATRGPLGLEGEHEGWLPPGIVPVEDVLGAKERPNVSVRAGATERAEVPVSGPKCPTPCVGTNFSTLDNASDVSPADPAGAAGDNHVVAAVNISFGVYSRLGAVEVAPRKFGRLFKNTKAFTFDPKVIYDQYNDTYLLVFLGFKRTDSWIFTVAIPDATATTKSTWCKRRIDGDQLNDGIAQLADYPGVGYDGKRVYIATNQFGFSKGYYGAQILAIPKGGLYDCDKKLRMTAFTGDKTRDPDGGKSASLQPAASDGSVLPPAEYLASFDYSCTNVTCKGDTLVLWRIKKTNKGLKLRNAAVDVGQAELPYFGTQKGAPSVNASEYWWDTGDLRVTNAFYDTDRNRLYTAHAVLHDVGDNSYEEATARWYEVEPAGTLGASTNPRTGYVGAPGLDMGWPAVATNDAGVLFMTVSGAGYPADEYLSVYATTVQTGTTTPDSLVQTHAGTTVHDWGGGPERWGDYNQINRDPSNGAEVWTFNQTADHGIYGFQHWVDLIADI